MLLSIARIAAGGAIAAAVGASLLPAHRARRGVARDLPLVVAAGLAVLAPALMLAGAIGVPLLAVELALGAAASWRIARRRRRGALVFGRPEPFALSTLVVAGAVGVFLWKMALLPIWTWDHYFVWGMKARHLFDAGRLDLTFLKALPFFEGNADYPLGLPLAWRALTLGAVPSPSDFRICHALFGIGAVLLVRRILLDAGTGRSIADGMAALVAVSPLFWDSEAVGIAELPLAAFSLAAAALLFDQDDIRTRSGALFGGLLLGFLPWIKKEGTWLAVLLLAAAFLAARAHLGSRANRLLIAAVPLALLGGAALLVERLLPFGSPFLVGPWQTRLGIRLPHTFGILAAMGRELLAPDWIGFWIAFPVAAFFAWRRRAARALALLAAVTAQVVPYFFVYAGTYLNPLRHIEASFFRLMTALLPLAAVAYGMVMGTTERSRTPSPVRGVGNREGAEPAESGVPRSRSG